MLDLIFAGGFVVAVAGALQTLSRRQSESAPAVSLLRQGLAGFEGADAQAVRAEFQRSGIALPERHRPAGFP